MRRSTISAALAARLLAERAPAEMVLHLELPEFDGYFEPRRDDRGDDEPTALVLEADGSFTEIRD